MCKMNFKTHINNLEKEKHVIMYNLIKDIDNVYERCRCLKKLKYKTIFNRAHIKDYRNWLLINIRDYKLLKNRVEQLNLFK